MKRVSLAVVLLALMAGCLWASTETSNTAGFTVIPDSEAAMIDESGRFPYQQYNFVLSAGLFQKKGFLSKEKLRIATLSGEKEPARSLLEITVSREDFTAVIAIEPETTRPLSCKIDETNGDSQLWEYKWASDGRSMPVEVTTTENSADFSETDNFKYQLVSEAAAVEDFIVELDYGTPVEYFPPPNSNGPTGSVVYLHNPAIDIRSLIVRRLQFTFSRQERKNCATAVLDAVEERFKVTFGDTSHIVHFPDANQVAAKRPAGVTSAIEIRDVARSKGLHSEIVRTDIAHLAALGEDTIAILYLPYRKHFTTFVGVYAERDVWVRQADTPKVLHILNRDDLNAWNGTTILISNKPMDFAGKAG